MTQASWVVHKFGGSSVATAAGFRNAAQLVLADRSAGNRAIVVSAMSGVTDALLALLEKARNQDRSWRADLWSIEERHRLTAAELLQGAELSDYCRLLEDGAHDVEHVVKSIELLRGVPTEARDLVSGFGELWSAPLLAAWLRTNAHQASWLDARKVLIVNQGETGPVVHWDNSLERLTAWCADHGSNLLVITGFVASTPDGLPTTLRRNGSDFTASIFGRLLNADCVTIWTDVDGVLSADPRRVPEAFVLPELSYDEAMELAYFGAKVLHPDTMGPVLHSGIPILIRNSLNPAAPGTRIVPRSPDANRPTKPAAQTVRGFSTIEHVALLNVEGSGMIGVPGVAQRLFGALRELGVSVVMIAQAGSEHSICFAVPSEQADRAVQGVEQAFFAELHQGRIQRIDRSDECTILAAVGDEMARVPGVAARFFGALARASVNVRAVAQGASERNITVVIDRKDAGRALRAAHDGFYLSNQSLAVGIIGAGGVGKALIEQLHIQSKVLREQFHIDVRVLGIARSKRMLLSSGGIDLATWSEDMTSAGQEMDLDAFVDFVDDEHLPHIVLVDCTSNESTARRYVDWMNRGIHIVTPNKKANSLEQTLYADLRALTGQHRVHFLYEATVGAGLPVITTLQDLVRTGDRILSIEGVLSGTLSYLFNNFDGAVPFSVLVEQARQMGYTEPDPRDDLSGMDVARKLIILAREMGLTLELSDIQLESLVPAELKLIPDPLDFLRALPQFDSAMQQRLATARAAGKVLRYVGKVDAQTATASVNLAEYASEHAFGGLSGTDNIIAFTTERYKERPLIVRGPGAGPQVTAGGVFADLLRLASYIGGI